MGASRAVILIWILVEHLTLQACEATREGVRGMRLTVLVITPD